MERMTIRGHDRAFDSSGNRRAAENHEAAGKEDDRTTADTCAEDRKRMEGEQRVLK